MRYEIYIWGSSFFYIIDTYNGTYKFFSSFNTMKEANIRISKKPMKTDNVFFKTRNLKKAGSFNSPLTQNKLKEIFPEEFI